MITFLFVLRLLRVTAAAIVGLIVASIVPAIVAHVVVASDFSMLVI